MSFVLFPDNLVVADYMEIVSKYLRGERPANREVALAAWNLAGWGLGRTFPDAVDFVPPTTFAVGPTRPAGSREDWATMVQSYAVQLRSPEENPSFRAISPDTWKVLFQIIQWVLAELLQHVKIDQPLV